MHFLMLSTLVGSVACGDLVGNAVLPPGTQSPDTYNTPEGALAAYRGVKLHMQTMVDVIGQSGALTDELMFGGIGSSLGSIGAGSNPTDERRSDETATQPFAGLQQVRGSAMEAIGLLKKYAPATSPAIRGEAYALEGYAELLLAELYCSGVPLSTLDFEGDFTYKPSSTTTDVLQHANVLFDSALTMSSDSPSVMWLASVSQGRALLDLGQYADAGAAVAAVPDTFQYRVPMYVPRYSGSLFVGFSVASGEGQNGLPFSATNDPRVRVTSAGSNPFNVPLFRPDKYPIGRTTPVVLASGLEARLIQAEAALHADADDLTWLTILNSLRTTCVDVASCPTPAPAGIGGIEGLPPLQDPGKIGGSDSARVTLLFTERAYWLFLTGHRQGDLRRLVRNYNRSQQIVYPTGPYFGGVGSYGTDVNLPIPAGERDNPLFHGCLNRGA
jgi:hypothetical protein